MKGMILGILAYTFAGVLVFGIAYGLMGFDKHFNNSIPGNNWGSAFYHSFAVQTTAMDECNPKTPAGRAVHCIQMLCGTIPMLLLLAPWATSSF
jgi:hypothetical protein